jgi:hypothetical protein
MLTHPTLDQLDLLGLAGMAKAFTEIEASGEAGANAKRGEPMRLPRPRIWL